VTLRNDEVMSLERDDAGYWDALATRVTQAALRPAETGAVSWLAQSRIAVVAVIVLSLLGLVLVARSPGQPNRNPAWAAALSPADGIGKKVTSGEEPPAIGALLLQASSGANR
jgi:hypothetical protein